MLEAALAAQAANLPVCVWTQQGVDAASSLKLNPALVEGKLDSPIFGTTVSAKQLTFAEQAGWKIEFLLSQGFIETGTLHCLDEHTMETRLAESTYVCDMCEKDIPIHNPLFDCRKCDFSVCIPCAAMQLRIKPVMARGILHCPNGHPMVEEVATCEYSCDGCGCDIKVGESLLDCRICDHSICAGLRCQSACHKAPLTARAGELSEKDLCVVCLSAPRTHAFVPCGHRCICEACGRQVKESVGVCPICRRAKVKLMRIYD